MVEGVVANKNGGREASVSDLPRTAEAGTRDVTEAVGLGRPGIVQTSDSEAAHQAGRKPQLGLRLGPPRIDIALSLRVGRE